jgi:hypothetical protein
MEIKITVKDGDKSGSLKLGMDGIGEMLDGVAKCLTDLATKVHNLFGIGGDDRKS